MSKEVAGGKPGSLPRARAAVEVDAATCAYSLICLVCREPPSPVRSPSLPVAAPASDGRSRCATASMGRRWRSPTSTRRRPGRSRRALALARWPCRAPSATTLVNEASALIERPGAPSSVSP